MKTAPPLLKALLVCFVLIASAAACCKHKNEPDPLPPTEKDTQRGFSQKTDDVVVEMPEEVVYVKEDVNNTLQSYNAETGTISFSNSDELERQNIKAGDILYSAQRTEIAPDGYSLRVTGVSRQGNTVTYQTEPASVLEVFDHLEETGTLKVGDLKSEDIKVYSLIARGGEDPKTKGLEISTDFGIENFSSTWDETSFDWVFYRQYCSSNPNKVAYEAKLKVIFQHESYEDKSSVLIDVGHIVLFSMMKMGVTAVVTLETGDDLSETETAIEWKNVQNNLVDKKYDLFKFPIVLGWANLVVNPSIVCTFQFGLGASGNLTFEAGFKDQVMAFNVENVGYFMPEFLKNSYIRSVSNGHPEMRMKAEAEVSAYASVGPGLRIEIPALQIKEDGEWQSSYVGAYVLGTLRGHADVNVELDPLSGGMSINSYGDGEAALELALQGKIGFNKLTTGDIDLRVDILSKTLGDWSWSYFLESPTPYNLNTKIDGNKATFSWDSRPTGMMSPVYDIYLDVGEGYVLYQAAWKQKSFVYTSEKDGVYNWKVVARTANGREYPCAQEQEFTILGNTTLKTLEPEIDVRQRKVVVPVSFSTKNKVKNYGVAFCDNEDFSGGWEEEPGTGIGYKFSVERHVPNHTTLYARGYLMVELEGNTSDSNQYHKFYGNVVKIVVDEEDAKALIRVSEDSAPFGEVEVGKTATLTRTVYNDGTADLVISSVTCSAEAFTPSWRSATIKPGKSQDITITFKPTEAKDYSGKMVLKSNASNAPEASFTIGGKGVAAAEAKLKVSRTFLEFEETTVGQSSTLDWTITNVGNAKLTVSSLTVPSGFSTDFSGWSSKSLEPNESHTFKVTFKPTEAKDYSGKMVFKSNASNAQEASFSVGGKGVVPAEAKLKVSRTFLEFEDTQVGQRSQLDWTITNIGNATLTVSSLKTPSGFSTDFSSWSSKSLEPNESHTFKVTFKPTEAKTYSGKMVLKSNAVNAQEASFSVGGKGIAAPVKMLKSLALSTNYPKAYFSDVSLNFSYDSQERLTSVGDGMYTFRYSGNTMTFSDNGSAQLNSSGQFSSITWRGATYKFKYDSQGRLTSLNDSGMQINYRWSGNDIYSITYSDGTTEMNPHFQPSPYMAPDKGVDVNLIMRIFLNEIGFEGVLPDGNCFPMMPGLIGKRSEHILGLQINDTESVTGWDINAYNSQYKGSDGQWHKLDYSVLENWPEGTGSFEVKGSNVPYKLECKPWVWTADSSGAVTKAVWPVVQYVASVTATMDVSRDYDYNGDGRINSEDLPTIRFRNVKVSGSSSQKNYSFTFTYGY